MATQHTYTGHPYPPSRALTDTPVKSRVGTHERSRVYRAGVHSYVSADKRTTFCIYDAPSPEAIRKTATRNELPVDQITQVPVLDPYIYL
jgi:hypothetical protein